VVERCLYVVLPALDEAPNLERVFHDLAGASNVAAQYGLTLHALLIDDGSRDGTADVAQHAADAEVVPLTVVRHDHRRGPGRAFATGFAAIADRLDGADYVLTLESDNTSRLEILDLMLRRSTGEGHDVVLASPYTYGGGIVGATRVRTLLSHIANSFVKAFLDIRGLMTVSSFYRLYRGSAVLRLQSEYGAEIVERRGFECMVELVLKMMYLHLSISEVPMLLDSSRRIGKSKMRVVRTAAGYLALFRHKRRWRTVADRSRADAAAPAGDPVRI
jgi:dolichol-phosphate mannosyltransferase